MLDDEDVMGVLRGDQELGVRALGVQRVRGDDMPGQVQRLQQAQVTGGQQFTVTGRQISDLLQGRGCRSN